MMRQMLFGVGVFLVSSSMVWAGQPTDVGQGLGSRQPLASDVSLSSHFHVYKFVKQGIEYLQINDNNGTVHAAIGMANGTVIVLPVGSDAQQVSTPDAPLSIEASGLETVFKDAQVTLTVGVSASGALVWSATPATVSTDVACDPNDCGINRVTSAVPTTAEECDANSCPINRVQSALSTTQSSSATQATSELCDANSCPINRQPLAKGEALSSC